MIEIKLLKNIFLVVLFVNIFYFVKVYKLEEEKLIQLAIKHKNSINYHTDDEVPFHDQKPYHLLNTQEKIAYLLHKVSLNQDNNYWLANTKVENPSIDIDPKLYLPVNNSNERSWYYKSELFYEPRFILSVILDELKNQLLNLNPKNIKENDHLIKLPFSWSDWVDLTMLNEEISKSIDEKRNCKWLQAKANKKTKYSKWCQNLLDLSDEEIEEIGIAREDLPGFIVRNSPMNKAPHREVMLQGKAHLFTSQENPISVIFLAKNGTYEAQLINKRQRLIHTDLFEKYLIRRGINPNNIEDMMKINMNPQVEFNELLNAIKPRPLNPDDDIHKMRQITKQTDTNVSRELYLDKDSFHYKQEEVDEQLSDYELRLNKIDESISNELKYDPAVISENRLNRHELNHYEGLKYANKFPVAKEPTYYKLATLKKNKFNQDAGWHYEWRFFNGALRYIKDETWTTEQLEVREQIILDRLLRNWFRFAEEKGIISWIAHGPLLSWYWDGLMFPFDIDIDIQMPSSELNRLSANYNMTLIVEDIDEGFGKYLIDCAAFLHHRDLAAKDNHIDARFIDVDTGTYIDITGIGINNERPPSEYDAYIRRKKQKGESVELYMDRRKHWLNFEKIDPLRYSLIGGVPVYVPNDILSMLNHEYSRGTKSYYFNGYYYVPSLRLWIQQDKLTKIFKPEQILDKKGEVNRSKLVDLVKELDDEGKLKILEMNEDILIEYYLTHKLTTLHEVEKKFMLDHSLQQSILNLTYNEEYHYLTSKFKMSKPIRKSLFDFEYYSRFRYMEKGEENNEPVEIIEILEEEEKQNQAELLKQQAEEARLKQEEFLMEQGQQLEQQHKEFEETWVETRPEQANADQPTVEELVDDKEQLLNSNDEIPLND
ncbi:unnamed protein product [Candida verbasci]|uniref:LicD/FKTN/FKRP nucleotidyltransferase domain-containing protein n=1 Tax=Candida verbasci TaxID=1227364 RepID=A0A9W4TYT7_9ASCO|nr:unnamed protein product [Candida verbasci]